MAQFPILSATYLAQVDRNKSDTKKKSHRTRTRNSNAEPRNDERFTANQHGERMSGCRDVLVEGGLEDSRTTFTSLPQSDLPPPTMAPKTHTWITAWFLLTAPIIAWDVGYCFLRPRSMEGGDLHWIWKPYSIYQRVDLVYGVEALERGDGFTNAQSLLNVIETLLNVLYVYLAHVKAWPPASLVGLSAATMTLSKTVLYWVQEYFCNYCAVGHNTMYDAIVYWIIPNGFWIVVPIFIVNRLSRDLAAELNFAAKAAAKSKSK